MRIVALIQARTGSTRLPDKVLMDLGGMTMLERVVRRTSRSRLCGSTAVVTSTELPDDRIVSLCADKGIPCIRGSEVDVLDRYLRAAKVLNANTIVRITSDCPFTEPEIIDQVIEAYNFAAVDYASNTLERTYPQGLDVEVFSFEALSEAARLAQKDHERTHVTPYIYQRPGRFKLWSVKSAIDYSHYRWTVDEGEDLLFARALYRAMGNSDEFGWQQAIKYLSDHPELVSINHVVKQKGLYEG